MTHTFTPADVDRLLGLADQFLEDWAESAMQSGKPDEEYEERNAEWQAICPLLVIAPQLLEALETLATLCEERGLHPINVQEARTAILKAKGSAPAATPTCADRAQWAEHAVLALCSCQGRPCIRPGV